MHPLFYHIANFYDDVCEFGLFAKPEEEEIKVENYQKEY